MGTQVRLASSLLAHLVANIVSVADQRGISLASVTIRAGDTTASIVTGMAAGNRAQLDLLARTSSVLTEPTPAECMAGIEVVGAGEAGVAELARLVEGVVSNSTIYWARTRATAAK